MTMSFTIFEKKENDPLQYYWFENGFSKQELSKIEQDVQSLPTQEATIFGGNSKEIRSSSVKWIPMEGKWEWLYQRLKQYIIEANDALWHFDLVAMPELIQYTEYYASEDGHYDWHQDIGPGMGSHRKISITVQLSDTDDYEGGDLEFMFSTNSKITAPRGAGNVVIFPSYMMHRVAKVTKGTRKSFVLWVGGEHYK